MKKSLSLIFALSFAFLIGCDGSASREIDGKLVTSTPAEWSTTTGELLAGTLTCTLTRCDTGGCTRGGCEPKADKSGCTACTCSGPWTCQSCSCEQTFEVETPVAEPLPVFEGHDRVLEP